MKKLLAALLSLTFILTGCAVNTAKEPTESEPPLETEQRSETVTTAVVEETETQLIGVSRTTAAYAYEDEWGLKLTAKDITPTSLTLVFTQTDSSISGQLCIGTPFSIEKLENGEWTALEYIPSDVARSWNDIALLIAKEDVTEFETGWNNLYGELTPGTYRISKEVSLDTDTGRTNRTYYAGFDIIEATDDTTISCEHDGFGVTLPYVPCWEYSIEEYSEDSGNYGVSFRPQGEDGWIRLHHWTLFGVCGTGLETKDYGTGTMGTYDGSSVWSFITYPASTGSFVATTEKASWLTDPAYYDAAMEIIDSALFEITTRCNG